MSSTQESVSLVSIHPSREPNVYLLFLERDQNNPNQAVHFLFGISNIKKGATYKFKVMNITKEGILVNEGMRVVAYSEKTKSLFRVGEEFLYFRNPANNLFTMSFLVTFPKDDESTVFLSNVLPYTYSMMIRSLKSLETEANPLMRIGELCQTSIGVSCPKVEFLFPRLPSSQAQEPGMEPPKRRLVVITGRIHPGENCSSFVMDAVLNCLKEAIKCPTGCSHTRFLIIPMINPDGVFLGNHRTNFEGFDLNRKWNLPKESEHKTIYTLKTQIKEDSKEEELFMVVDLHGHNKKKNCFVCNCPSSYPS